MSTIDNLLKELFASPSKKFVPLVADAVEESGDIRNPQYFTVLWMARRKRYPLQWNKDCRDLLDKKPPQIGSLSDFRDIQNGMYCWFDENCQSNNNWEVNILANTFTSALVPDSLFDAPFRRYEIFDTFEDSFVWLERCLQKLRDALDLRR